MSSIVRVGLASFGLSGRVFHAPLIEAHPGFRLVHVVERNAKSAHERFPHVRSSTSIDALCADPEVDLIIVNTPDAFHAQHAMQALKAGKHVIVEKPFTQRVEDAARLISYARARERILSVFQNRRWDGDFLTVQKVIQSGELGRIVEFVSHYDRYRPHIQSGTWKERAESGTGLLYNLGSHMIDQALVLFGMPDAITAHIRTMRPNGEVDDWISVRLHYPSINVSVHASYLVCDQGPRYVVHGMKGTFTKYGLDPQEERMRSGAIPGGPDWGKEEDPWWGTLATEMNGTTERRQIETLPGNYLAYYDGIHQAILEGAVPPVSAEEGLNVIRVIEAAQASAREGRTITL